MRILHRDDKTGIIAGYESDCSKHFHYFEPKDKNNFEGVAKAFGLTCENMVRVSQKHTDKVLAVGNENGGEGVVRPGIDESYDALVTDAKNLMLCIVTADCVPVFIFDEVAGVIGLAHSGRAGTMSEIAAKTVFKMQKMYGAKPENMRVFLGPYLCMEHHEVNKKDVLGFFDTFLPKEREQFLIKRGEKFYVDMGTAIRISLRRTGIIDENIVDKKICTFEDESLPSWRRTHDPDGRALSFIVISENKSI